MRRAIILGAGALLLLGLGVGYARYSGTHPPVSAAAVPTSANVADQEDVPEPPIADERTKEMRRFDRYDSNSDGRIALPEFLATRQKAFARLDLNHDGQLSFDEYAAKARDKFTKADQDKSQTLDRAEFAATKPVRKMHASVKCPPAQPAGEASEG